MFSAAQLNVRHQNSERHPSNFGKSILSDVEFNGYHEFALKPDPRQFSLLEAMMEGPVFLQRLIAMSVNQIDTIEHAASFLDKNWKRLVPYMFGRNSGQTPRAMEHLILRLANEPLEEFYLEFPANCTLTASQRVLFPIPNLAAVSVEDNVVLEIARKGTKHSGSFTLLRTQNGYSVGIEFERIALPPQRSTSQVIKKKVHSHTSPSQNIAITSHSKPRLQQRRAGMSAQEFLTSFNNRVTAHLKQQLAVSRQFTTTRFTDLSGWGVSGGLPSLPKRR